MIPIIAGFVVAAVLVVACLVWVVRESGNPGPVEGKPGKPLSPEQGRRAELIEARKTVERQLEILQCPVGASMRNAPCATAT